MKLEREWQTAIPPKVGKLIQRFCFAEAFVSLAELDYVQQVYNRMNFCNLNIKCILLTWLSWTFGILACLYLEFYLRPNRFLLIPPGQEKTICEQSLTTATSMTKIIQVSDMYCNTSLNDFISKRMQGQSGSFGYKERGNQVWFLFFWKSPLVFHMVYVANRHTCKVPEIWQIYLRKKVGGYGYGSELICRFVEGFMETLFTPLTF